MELGNFIIFAVISWCVIMLGQIAYNAIRISELTTHVAVLKRLDEIIHQVNIEKVKDIEYWYDEKDKFLAQGKSLEEVIDVLKLRFPDHVFLLENRGGIGAQTDWKLMTPEEVKQAKIFDNIIV